MYSRTVRGDGNRGQVNHAEVETEPSEPENQEEVLVEAEEIDEEDNEQRD
jgi:hypothetical protein